jgi:hypothetical protein
MVRFAAPERRHFKSALAEYAGKEVVEITVRTSGPIPARALGPALYVGTLALIECAQVGINAYRFTAFDPKALKRGSPIILAWMGEPLGKKARSKFRFELTKER